MCPEQPKSLPFSGYLAIVAKLHGSRTTLLTLAAAGVTTNPDLDAGPFGI